MNSLLIQTPIGLLIAFANERSLLKLQFVNPIENKNLIISKHLSGSRFLKERQLDLSISEGYGAQELVEPLLSIRKELSLYFKGSLRRFETPLFYRGTAFQERVWGKLLEIPFGETRSYLDLAKDVGSSLASRAVGSANRANPLVIVIPCHRVIQSSGKLGGYIAGDDRKKKLLDLERKLTK